MYATATVVEIDNRLTRQRSKIIIPIPNGRLLHRLREQLLAVDPQTGESVLLDRDPECLSPVEAFVSLDPWGRIRVVVYPTGAAESVQRGYELVNGRAGEACPAANMAENFEAHHLSENLADNLRFLIEQRGISVEDLAAVVDIVPTVLKDILAKTIGASLGEISNLAKFFGTTCEALLRRRRDEGAGEWK
jgi:plasmid maintenance system antidote protein VapI